MSSAETVNAPNDVAMIDENKIINIDILPLLQIIKHAQGASPTIVSGQLLGLENDNHVDITYAFGMPISEGDLQQVNQREFQDNMINCLKKINIDTSVVGWYVSTFMSTFATPQLIYTQYEYQVAFGNNIVVIVIDSYDLNRGKLTLKAYRLTQQFVKLFGEGKINISDLRENSLDSSMIFEEVPLRLCVNELASVLLHQCDLTTMISGETTPVVNPVTTLEKNVEQLNENLDLVINERKEYAYQVMQAYKQKQWNYLSRNEHSHAEVDDVFHTEVEMEDSAVAQMEENNRVSPLLNYCSVMDVCKRLGSISTDDSKVLEKKL